MLFIIIFYNNIDIFLKNINKYVPEDPEKHKNRA